MVVKKIFHHLKRGKLTFIGKPLFMGMVTVELLFERIIDSILGRNFESLLVDEKLTAVIKTFERPNELKRLVLSIKRFYPNMQIIVVDDSREPTFIDGVKTIVMPYDTGISAGRNRAMKEIQTEFFLLLDDDYVFYRKTVLEPALELMLEHSEIDIMGGVRVDLPLYGYVDYSKARLHPNNKDAKLEKGSEVVGLPVYDMVANFFIARPERIQIIGWDEDLKKIEHTDFFTQAKGVLTTVYNQDFKVLHAQTLFNQHYMKKRYDISSEQQILQKKYYENY